MVVFLPGQGRVTSGTVTPTEIPHVSDNGNIMQVRAALKKSNHGVGSTANNPPVLPE